MSNVSDENNINEEPLLYLLRTPEILKDEKFDEYLKNFIKEMSLPPDKNKNKPLSIDIYELPDTVKDKINVFNHWKEEVMWEWDKEHFDQVVDEMIKSMSKRRGDKNDE